MKKHFYLYLLITLSCQSLFGSSFFNYNVLRLSKEYEFLYNTSTWKILSEKTDTSIYRNEYVFVHAAPSCTLRAVFYNNLEIFKAQKIQPQKTTAEEQLEIFKQGLNKNIGETKNINVVFDSFDFLGYKVLFIETKLKDGASKPDKSPLPISYAAFKIIDDYNVIFISLELGLGTKDQLDPLIKEAIQNVRKK